MQFNLEETLMKQKKLIAAYKDAVRFMRDMLPRDIRKIKEYKAKAPILTKYMVEEQLLSLYKPVVSLRSGGYIVINPTEALTAIDVNSGRAISERNIEETALKTNLEAAKEIAKQLVLRDISGLIVIDFIDMTETKHRRIIEQALKEFLSRDKARIHTSNISQFGLLEMSRQRLRPSFMESNSMICSHCSGKGVVRGQEQNSMLILRTIENEIFNDQKIDIVNVYSGESTVIYLLNYHRNDISHIEKKYNLKINFYADHSATSDCYSIEKIISGKNADSIDLRNKPALQDFVDICRDVESEDSKHPRQNKHKWRNTEEKKSPDLEKIDSQPQQELIESNVGVVEQVVSLPEAAPPTPDSLNQEASIDASNETSDSGATNDKEDYIKSQRRKRNNRRYTGRRKINEASIE
jgi:ribonuclease E